MTLAPPAARAPLLLVRGWISSLERVGGPELACDRGQFLLGPGLRLLRGDFVGENIGHGHLSLLTGGGHERVLPVRECGRRRDEETSGSVGGEPEALHSPNGGDADSLLLLSVKAQRS